MSWNILIIDFEQSILEKFEMLKENNILTIATNILDLKNNLTKIFDIAILNSKNNGLDIIKKINLNMPYISIIDSTELNINTIEIIEQSLKMGAYKCLSAENISSKIHETIKDAIKNHQINKNLDTEAQMQIVSKSLAMQKTIKEIKKLKTAYTISIIGSTGSGKKFLAKHFAKKWNKNFKIIDCLSYDAIQELNSLENIIFNLSKTNEQVFIINHPEQLSSEYQNKLFHLILNAIGKSQIQWIIIIDKKDERNLINPLLERVSIFKVYLPEIEERKEDVNDIIKILVKQFSSTLNKKIKQADLEMLKKQELPNNFKHLKIQIEHLFYQSNEKFSTKNVDLIIDDMFLNMNLKDATILFEKIYLQRQMIDKKAKLKTIAKIAQINRTTLYRKLNKIIKS